MNHLIYKNYHGSIEYSKEDKLLYGKVLGIKSLISYEGKTGVKLEKDFQEAVDFYLADCDDQGIEPEVAFKGSFNVRVPSNVHMELAMQAKAKMTSLNNYVRGILEENLMLRQAIPSKRKAVVSTSKKIAGSKRRSTAVKRRSATVKRNSTAVRAKTSKKRK